MVGVHSWVQGPSNSHSAQRSARARPWRADSLALWQTKSASTQPSLTSLRVPEHEDHRVPTEEELADETVLVHRLRLLLPTVGDLCPHLADILEDHVGVTVERLHARQDLPVVPAVD